MQRPGLSDLNAFVMIVGEGSFTRAASRLGISQSALSHTMRRLEESVGVRLLTRTTRSIGLTEAGARLLATLTPALHDIHAELDAIGNLREKPAGTIRITSPDLAAHQILLPAIGRLVQDHPDIHVEVSVDSALTDLATDRFDAGVRIGEALAPGMIAARIGPDVRMAVVGSPAYFARHPKPLIPQDLIRHACINLRLASAGGFYAWELEKDGVERTTKVTGPLAFNNAHLIREAVIAGFGLGFLMEGHVALHLVDGSLVRVLEDWCPFFPGFHLYYPSRRQPSAAFTLLVEALRYRG